MREYMIGFVLGIVLVLALVGGIKVLDQLTVKPCQDVSCMP